MNIKIFDIPAICSEEAIEQVNKFLRGHKVLDVDRQFYLSSGNMGHWSLLVTYLPIQSSFSIQERREKVDYKTVLDETAFAKFTKLRVIRKQLADDDAVPAYAVFTDAELAQIAQLSSIDATLLARITGIGEKRMAKYGNLICERYNETSGESDG
ncbi:MAG: HRDC domain-containing protein [Paraprevotella sp.]|nr:HRDC domain-containing protein [Paraprevotella sp.]